MDWRGTANTVAVENDTSTLVLRLTPRKRGPAYSTVVGATAATAIWLSDVFREVGAFTIRYALTSLTLGFAARWLFVKSSPRSDDLTLLSTWIPFAALRAIEQNTLASFEAARAGTLEARFAPEPEAEEVERHNDPRREKRSDPPRRRTRVPVFVRMTEHRHRNPRGDRHRDDKGDSVGQGTSDHAQQHVTQLCSGGMRLGGRRASAEIAVREQEIVPADLATRIAQTQDRECVVGRCRPRHPSCQRCATSECPASG